MLRGAQHRQVGESSAHSRQRATRQPSEYDFLRDRLVDTVTLDHAEAIAVQAGVYPHQVLIAKGWINEDDYAAALAMTCGTDCIGDVQPDDTALPSPDVSIRDCLTKGLLSNSSQPRSVILAADRLRPNDLRAILAQLPPRTVSLASPGALRRAVCRHFAQRLATTAVDGLQQRFPEQSARSPGALWPAIVSCAGLVALTAAAILGDPVSAIRALTLGLAVVFVPVIGLRIAATWATLRAPGSSRRSAVRVPDKELPVYTILVPLYREAAMLPSIVGALARLDYPAAKIEIKLLLEEVDAETIAAARALDLPGSIEVVIVPDVGPRTKPKALNYALPLVRGEFLVIYDAEDRPEPDQLRKAVTAFQLGPPNLACVQARLGIYNTRDNWLTRQFAVEYSALFDGMLPTLDRYGLPIPLGGTSNHLRVSALKWLMAWDPFNVTEDADLGIRLARNGYRCAVLDSTTFEEAPSRVLPWLYQRTRWLKGYMQTWLVHMREPGRLWRELGPRGFLAFQVMVGGTVLSALVHPLFFGLAAFDFAYGSLLQRPGGLLGVPFWLIAWFDLLTGYLAAMALAASALKLKGARHLLWHVAMMPLYWLLVSAAAYRALWKYRSDRFAWEKTDHGLARNVEVPWD